MKNYIFEIENKSEVEEHQDIVGGPQSSKLQTAIDIIRNTWTSCDDYWLVEIKARYKDHNKYNTGLIGLNGWLGVGGNRVGYAYIYGSSAEEAVKMLQNINITLFNWSAKLLKQAGYQINGNVFPTTDGNMDAVYKLCDLFFARAYFNLNKKSFKQTGAVFQKLFNKPAHNISEPGFLNIAIYSKGCPIYAYIDCDIDPDSESRFHKGVYGRDEINRLIEFLKKNKIDIKKIENSHDGVHIYLDFKQFSVAFPTAAKAREAFKQFDQIRQIGKKYVREFSTNRKDDDSVLEKRGSGSILLYSPCGKAPDRNLLLNTAKNAEDVGRIKKTRRYNAFSQDQAQDWYNKNEQLDEADLNIRHKIGKNGPLTTKNLLNPNEIFASTLKLIEKYKKLKRNVSFEEFFKNDPGYLVWKNYVKSMTGIEKYEPILMKNGKPKKDYKGNPIMVPVIKNIKNVKSRDKHGNVVLDKDGKPVFEKYPKIAIGFLRWIENMTTAKKVEEFGGIASKIYAYKYNNSYLFGYYNLGVFIANSFAGDDGGIAPLIQSICGYNNVVFAVSMDLAHMLVKIGLYTDGKVHTTTFGGEVIKKMTLTTNPDLIGIANSMDKKDQNNGKKNEVNVNLIKNKKLRNFLFSNPDIMDDIMNDDGVKKYVEEHPEQMEQLVTKIVNDLFKKKHVNYHKQ